MEDRHVQLFKALSDITRQEILRMLLGHEMNVSEICRLFENISQPTVSHHLQILRHCGLVDIRKEGRVIYYMIQRDFFCDSCQEFFGRFNIRIELKKE